MVRPESNVLKIFVHNTFKKFHLLCFSVFPLCLHYAPRLAALIFLQLSWNILINECSIRVFHYKVTVLLEIIDQRGYVQYN